MGCPPKLTDAQKAEARRRRAETATLRELASSYNVGKSTFFTPSRVSTSRSRSTFRRNFSSQNGRFDEGVVQNLHPS